MCPSKDYKNKRPQRIFTFPKRDLPTIGNCLVKIRNWSLPPEKWYIIQHGPRIFAASQGALNTEQLSSPKRWFSHSMLCWCSLSLNIVCCSGLHDIKRMLRFLKVSRGRPKCGRRGGRPVRRGWGPQGCPGCRRGGRWVASPLPAAPWGWRRALLLGCPWPDTSKGPKLHQGRLRLDTEGNPCTVRVVRNWDRLLREVVGALNKIL